MTEKAKAETKVERDARFAAEMSVTLDGMRACGVMDAETYKLTLRDLNREGMLDAIPPLTGEEIRAIRERAHLSQAVFAKYLHLSVDHVSKLERGQSVRPAPPSCFSM